MKELPEIIRYNVWLYHSFNPSPDLHRTPSQFQPLPRLLNNPIPNLPASGSSGSQTLCMTSSGVSSVMPSLNAADPGDCQLLLVNKVVVVWGQQWGGGLFTG